MIKRLTPTSDPHLILEIDGVAYTFNNRRVTLYSLIEMLEHNIDRRYYDFLKPLATGNLYLTQIRLDELRSIENDILREQLKKQ